MVLHTIIPLEQVFGGRDSTNPESINYEYRRTGNHFTRGAFHDRTPDCDRPGFISGPQVCAGKGF